MSPALAAGLHHTSHLSPQVAQLLPRLGGTGLDLLGGILRPMLWRNTISRVSGVLNLPPVHHLCISVALGPGELALVRELLRGYGEGVLVQARALLAIPGGSAAGLLAAANTVTQATAASWLQGSEGGRFAARTLSTDAVVIVAREALWDLRCAAVHAAADGRVYAKVCICVWLAAASRLTPPPPSLNCTAPLASHNA